MNELISQMLPHIGAALVIASIILTVSRRFSGDQRVYAGIFSASFVICLIPLPDNSISHFARVVTGDLSMTSLLWLTFIATRAITTGSTAKSNCDIGMAITIVAAAIVLYPTALGLGMTDIYAEGFHPDILAPLLFLLFAICLWFGQWLPLAILASGFLTYRLGWLESDNLWDYILDPVIVIYALTLVIRERRRLRDILPAESQLETILGLALLVVLGTALNSSVA